MLTDIFAVGKFDYGVIVRYQNLTRKPELFRVLRASQALSIREVFHSLQSTLLPCKSYVKLYGK